MIEVEAFADARDGGAHQRCDVAHGGGITGHLCGGLRLNRAALQVGRAFDDALLQCAAVSLQLSAQRSLAVQRPVHLSAG